MLQRETCSTVDNHHLRRVLAEPLLCVVESDPWGVGCPVPVEPGHAFTIARTLQPFGGGRTKTWTTRR